MKKPKAAADQPMFVTWEPDDKAGRALAIASASTALRRVEPVVRSHGSDLYLNVAPNNVSVRDGMNRGDYEDFRPAERGPAKPKEYIRDCMAAYHAVGVVRNVIDLMADFGSQGIDLNHPNERIERWYKEWFRRVNGKERSERFLNLLFRAGNVIVQRQTAKIPVRVERQMRAAAAPDLPVPEEPPVERREIPWRYVFRNPLSTECVEEELSAFVGPDAVAYAVKLPRAVVAKVKNPKSAAEKALVKRLPDAVRRAVKAGGHLLPLDPDKVRAFFYKRDDWEVWARPMCSAILKDLQVLEKMKLADLAALDGAISCIRVWRLGNIEARIMPTEAAIGRLAEMLCNNVGGGVMDLVWGPEIDLVETKTDVHQFLGETKYAPVLTAIYAGLGIPPTLTGAATNGGGFTNNFISLKTLTERLEYGRDVLTRFWQEEIRLVQRAMGFRFPAAVVFDRMVLSDEAAEKQLLLNLADRDLISAETLMERFGETPEIEMVRIRREQRKRANGLLPPKASPFHPADKEHEYKKLFIQSGTLAPSEVGIDLEERKAGEQSPAELSADLEPAAPAGGAGTKGQPGQGRPRLSKDGQKRKQKRVLPRTSAAFFQAFAWAEAALAKVRAVAAPAYLKALGKKTLRELTADEAARLEDFTFYALCQLGLNQPVDAKAVAALKAAPLRVPPAVTAIVRATVAKHVEANGKEPPLDALRKYRAAAYALWKGDFGGD